MIVKLKDMNDKLIASTNIDTPGSDAMPMYIRLTDKSEKVLIYCGDAIYREINTVPVIYDGQLQIVSENKVNEIKPENKMV